MKRSDSFRIIQYLVLFTVLAVTGTLLFLQGYYFSTLFIALLLGGLSYLICRIPQKLTQMWLRMMEGIRYSELAFSFPQSRGHGPEKELIDRLNAALSHLCKGLIEKEETFQWYESLLSALDSGLLAVTADGHVEWMNPVAMRDLTGEPIRHIEELQTLSPDFPQLLTSILPGQVKVITLEKRELNRALIVSVTGFQSKGRELRLVSLRNIYSLLDQQELESWQKLIRVLTHEIMNSITPIISLSETLYERMQETKEEDPVKIQAMKTIYRRSKGLLDFVHSYRTLTRLSRPQRSPLEIQDFFSSLRILYPDGAVRYRFETQEPLPVLFADRGQMEQMFLNLLKNATEACQEQKNPRVDVTAYYDTKSGLLHFSIRDNGTGIPEEVKERIFVPFFTTKPGGSGIGLSLCKQIMTLHEGTLTVTSREKEGSTFTLHFYIPNKKREIP